MDRAFSSRFALDSRTSFGDPVDPEVLTSSARSGWSSCRVPGRRSAMCRDPSAVPITTSGS